MDEEIKEFEKFHPRAVKLLRKQKPFIVIAIDEPYFMKAYDMIRLNEMGKGTWTDEDEQRCIELWGEWKEEHKNAGSIGVDECPECQGMGKLSKFNGYEPCEACNGTGIRR